MGEYDNYISNRVLDTKVGTLVGSLNGATASSFNTLFNKSTAKWMPSMKQKVTDTIFKKLDANKDGRINTDELRKYLKDNYNLELNDIMNWTTEKLVDYIEEMDNRKSNTSKSNTHKSNTQKTSTSKQQNSSKYPTWVNVLRYTVSPVGALVEDLFF